MGGSDYEEMDRSEACGWKDLVKKDWLLRGMLMEGSG
jgi:hypothetical protein